METFIITGVQMRNKGSQAMFLSIWHALKSAYENCEVIAFATKYDSPEQYAFKLLPFGAYSRFVLQHRLHRVPLLEPILTYLVAWFLKSDKWNGAASEIDEALRRADAIFDASGYTLGSGWPKQSGRMLLQTIRLARRYKKKIILMPQSFGPFDWGGKDDAHFMKQVKKELTYPLKIYAREKEGYDCLVSLGIRNAELSADMVIREKAFPKVRDILADWYVREIGYPPRNSVGLILNDNLFRIGDGATVLELYARIVERLVENGETICILNTSTADTGHVERLLEKIPDRHGVNVISGEYSSPELIDIISKFKYIVASRYHSVVFGYRSGVPAVILGWASKYADLAELFGQQDHVFDIREADVDRIVEHIARMGADYEEESLRIRERLKSVQATSLVQEALSALQ